LIELAQCTIDRALPRKPPPPRSRLGPLTLGVDRAFFLVVRESGLRSF
jgi:hypothetical protein